MVIGVFVGFFEIKVFELENFVVIDVEGCEFMFNKLIEIVVVMVGGGRN